MSDVQDIAVFDDVFFSFHSVETLFARGGDRAAFNKVIVGDRFGFDKAPLEIRMNHSGCFGRGITGMNGPGARFFFAGRKIGLVNGSRNSRSAQRLPTVTIR